MRICSDLRRAIGAASAATGLLLMIGAATAQLLPGEINGDNAREIVANITRQDRTPKTVGATFVRLELTIVGDQMAPAAWSERSAGRWMNYREIGREAGSIQLLSADNETTLVFNFASKTVTGEVKRAGGSVEPVSGQIFDVSAEACKWQRPPGPVSCICDLRSLRPLQGAVGFGEVAKKTRDIEDVAQRDQEKKDLHDDPIKVVQGPAGDLFVLDHHHGARAWIKSGYPMGVCIKSDLTIANDGSSEKQPVSQAPGQFYSDLAKLKLIRSVDGNGRAITPEQLPRTLEALPDDPYRTLAWMVRKDDGFCRKKMSQPPPEFAEFQWADAMRDSIGKLAFANVTSADIAKATAAELWEARAGETNGQLKARRKEAQKKVLKAALKFAESSAAEKLPGYQGTAGLKDDACNP